MDVELPHISIVGIPRLRLTDDLSFTILMSDFFLPPVLKFVTTTLLTIVIAVTRHSYETRLILFFGAYANFFPDSCAKKMMDITISILPMRWKRGGWCAILPIPWLALLLFLQNSSNWRRLMDKILFSAPDAPIYWQHYQNHLMGFGQRIVKGYKQNEVYAPAAAIGKNPNRNNAENPALYRVFPFGLSGIGSSDYDIARNTFEHRICILGNGWSMDAIWAARLGLGEESCELLSQHAMCFNRFRYGGWDSNDSSVFPDRLAVVPFTDAGGLSAFALNEILLQSHNDIIRIIPAVAKSWFGIFQLRAEGSFLVAADFQNQKVRFVEIRSILGKECTVVNPWRTTCIVREGSKALLRSDAQTIQFQTRPGHIYIIEQAEDPLAKYRPAEIKDQPNQSPGLPGRD